FNLLLDLLGEALASRADPRQATEAASMDGALLIRLGPTEEKDGYAEIITSNGILRGPDCEVTIRYVHEVAIEDLPAEPELVDV
ncbi:MAG: DUF2397 family protein, partial [Chthoniobacter sp.]|uniref:DUF2397 family protein n=1 Tax=Chthoniobacter sp. TaxID=2510640 RepID=UPI0032ABA0F3